MRHRLTFAIALLLSRVASLAFHSSIKRRNGSFETRLCAKGFGGGGGFGGSTQKKVNKKAVLKKVGKKYGGTSSQDIAQGTQKEIEKAMQALPPHLLLATQLYQKLQQWDTKLESLSVLQQANIPQEEMEGANRARSELERLYSEHDLSENDLHNIFQKITWDASADAKAARALTGDMPRDISERVQKACDIVAEAVSAAGKDGHCLDVGCGFGVMVPFLKKSGVAPSQIHGVDLSPEMIRNAMEQHPGIQFEACDFLSYETETSSGFDAITFCTSLHDMPDMLSVLRKAASLLRLGGKLVIVHPQGASHVLNQSRANPILVKRGLPDAQELGDLDIGLRLQVAPATANSPEESRLGYLAVLEKR